MGPWGYFNAFILLTIEVKLTKNSALKPSWQLKLDDLLTTKDLI